MAVQYQGTIFGYLHIWVDNSAHSQQCCSSGFSLRGFWLWQLFRAVVNRDYLLLLDLFGQMVSGGAAVLSPQIPDLLDPQRNLWVLPCGIQVSQILRCEQCQPCPALTARVLVKLWLGVPRSGIKNLIFYFILVQFGFANLIKHVLEGSLACGSQSISELAADSLPIIIRW